MTLYTGRAAIVAATTLLIVGCASPPSTRSRPTPAAAEPDCTSINRQTIYNQQQILAECARLALRKTDSNAAMGVASYYEMRGDREAALTWYERAAEFGSVRALEWLVTAYYFGVSAPKNLAKVNEYLTKAANAGETWAQLVIADQIEKPDPDRALRIYLDQAQRGNCYAQARLSQAYVDGDLTERSLTHAYFWLLLASVGRTFQGHPLLGGESSRSAPGQTLCFSVRRPSTSRLEGALPADLTRTAQEAATTWRRGDVEPPLPTFAGVARPERSRPAPAAPPSAPPRVAARPSEDQMVPRPQWNPLPAATMLPPASGSRDLATLFTAVSRSVWVVFAARSAADLEAGTGVAVGSAVAVSLDTLLTNCHVVSGRPLVWIKQGETVVESTVVHADRETDRCILAAPKAKLQPVPGMRRYNDLKVGESVYTIGSPRGLERSLGQGIISGLREREQQQLIQTTAQISPGSSGGGLFDQYGNLLGITTFRLKDSEGLNFAIALDEFFRP